MKLWKQVLSLAAVCGFSATALFGQDANQDAVDEMDMQAVKMYVSNKRALFLEDKVNNLNISGDIRFEWQWKDEEHAGGDVIDGPKDDINRPYIGNNSFDVELNLYVDHVAERTWAKAWLEFDNNAGIMNQCVPLDSNGNSISGAEDCETGRCDDVCLRQAWFGYNIFEEGTSRLDIEIGRNPLYKLFESRVQFGNTFDGILMTYSNTFEGVGDFVVRGGLFVIDYHGDHYGWAVEAGLLNIADIGLDLRVSHIDWSMSSDRHENASNADIICDEVYSFQTTQVSGEFRFDPDMLNVDMKLYGAVLYNWDAKDITNPAGKKDDEPWAWYVGLAVGRLEQEGDWMIDGNYQYVEANAVQGDDVNGVGRGNSRKVCAINNTSFNGGVNAAGVPGGQGGGNGNYMGFQIEGAYALTDNIVISAEFEYSDEAEDDFGGDHEYRKFEVEVLYAF